MRVREEKGVSTWRKSSKDLKLGYTVHLNVAGY
jgi:hypothetical protein